MTRYVAARATLFAAAVGLVVAVEYVVSEIVGFQRTPLSLMLTFVGIMLVGPRLTARMGATGWLRSFWKRHMVWERAHPWRAAVADGMMIFVFVFVLALSDGFVYALWNAAACGTMVACVSTVGAAIARRTTKRSATAATDV